MFLPNPQHMPCNDCGASVAREERERHRCEENRRLDYLLFQHRDEIDAFDSELSCYLESPEGRFAVWDAEVHRRPSRPQ
jgi:hypothetical protein